MPETALGKRIRELRQIAGLSQSELADRIGVHSSYIGHLETGRIKLPSQDILLKMAKVLDASSEDLLRAAGYLPPEAPNLDLADPKLRFYLSSLGDLPEEDRQLIIEIIRQFLERNRKRREQGG
jgi:transcriptional regulator with XRE-family HTH domain